ncbi:MAG: caspase family protein [Chitinophagaceae bacterium]|nr:caspase family protein [Chitinophagaceae bacterium]
MKHLNRYILIVVFMLAGIRSEAISIYEISYEFTKLVDFPKYKAMLVRYGNGTGFMRVRYTSKDGKEVYVVNMEFDEVEGRSKIDGLPHLTLQFKGKNPVYIVNTSKSKQNEAYNPDLLWFKKLTTDKNFKPWGVTSQNMDGTWEQGKILNVKLMNTEDLTKSYVKQYFLETEVFYANLFKQDNQTVQQPVKPIKPPTNNNASNNSGVGSNNPNAIIPKTNPTTTKPATPAKIHFILVANTNDPRIGNSVQKDVVNITSQLKDVSVFLKLPMETTEISGAKFNKANVEAAVNKLSPGPDDIVIFYYSGHGFSFDQDSAHPYPQFDLRESRFDDITVATLNAGDVYSKIKSKKARLNLIICDCCNSNLGLLKPEGNSFALTAKSLMTWDRNFCSNLFMKSKGSIIATAAKQGQYAYGNTDVGGYFTSNLVTALEKYMSKFQLTTPTWEEIIAEAQKTTVTLSMSNTCSANKSCRQDPIYNLDILK